MRTAAAIVLFMLLTAAIVALVVLMVRARRNPPAPPRPEVVRAQFERLKHRSTAERVAGWVLLFPIVVPGVLLLAVGDGRARTLGVMLFGSFAFALALSVATGRSGRYEKVRDRALARSEAYWSQRPPES
jgi:hypothetical protein